MPLADVSRAEVQRGTSKGTEHCTDKCVIGGAEVPLSVLDNVSQQILPAILSEVPRTVPSDTTLNHKNKPIRTAQIKKDTSKGGIVPYHEWYH